MAKSRFSQNTPATVSRSTPRGLDYFLYGPKLKAQAMGQAMGIAGSINYDTTGIHELDREHVNTLVGRSVKDKDEFVNKLLDGEELNDKHVNNLVRIFNESKTINQSIKEANLNAAKITKMEDEIWGAGQASGDPHYYNQIMNESLENWGGTFKDGKINSFELIDAPRRMDPIKEYHTEMGIAYNKMTNEEKSAYRNASWRPVSQIDPETGKRHTAYEMKIEGDKSDNHKAIESVYNRYMGNLDDPNTDLNRYAGFVEKGKEGYTQSLRNDFDTIRDMYKNENVRPGEIRYSGFKLDDSNGSGKDLPPPSYLPEGTNQVAQLDLNNPDSRSEVSMPNIDDFHEQVGKTSIKAKTGNPLIDAVGGWSISTHKKGEKPVIHEFNTEAYNSKVNRAEAFVFGRNEDLTDKNITLNDFTSFLKTDSISDPEEKRIISELHMRATDLKKKIASETGDDEAGSNTLRLSEDEALDYFKYKNGDDIRLEAAGSGRMVKRRDPKVLVNSQIAKEKMSLANDFYEFYNKKVQRTNPVIYSPVESDVLMSTFNETTVSGATKANYEDIGKRLGDSKVMAFTKEDFRQGKKLTQVYDSAVGAIDNESNSEFGALKGDEYTTLISRVVSSLADQGTAPSGWRVLSRTPTTVTSSVLPLTDPSILRGVSEEGKRKIERQMQDAHKIEVVYEGTSEDMKKKYGEGEPLTIFIENKNKGVGRVDQNVKITGATVYSDGFSGKKELKDVKSLAEIPNLLSPGVEYVSANLHGDNGEKIGSVSVSMVPNKIGLDDNTQLQYNAELKFDGEEDNVKIAETSPDKLRITIENIVTRRLNTLLRGEYERQNQ